jgi:pimeloyl-ACP methyl ester carboxylesterase
MSSTVVRRTSVDVDGRAASYLTAGDGPVVLLLHGTYWSRVWLPVVEPLAAAGLRPVAVDLPGCGRSEGELTLQTATVPELAAWLVRFHAALGGAGPVAVAGHDIGGAVAQHVLVTGGFEVGRLALVNSVTYDSWPVPGVARFRDPGVVAATTARDIVAARRQALTAALARPATEDELADYLAPWSDPRVARSWMALAGAADSRYTGELVDALRDSQTPKLLVWGEDDAFQPISYAERFAAEMPRSRLVGIPDAGHIPMENDPATVADALSAFFTEDR